MKLKRNAIVLLILGAIIFLAGIMVPIISMKIYTAQHGAIGIIGGADTPTMYFMAFRLMNGLPFVAILFGITLIVSAGFCLIFSNTVKKHCNINTSVISLGLSGFGALGLICAFLWFSIVSFGETLKNPIEYPVSILLGIVCFFAFLVLIVVYLKLRKTNWSIKGFCIDILTSIIYLPAFFFVFSYFYGLLN